MSAMISNPAGKTFTFEMGHPPALIAQNSEAGSSLPESDYVPEPNRCHDRRSMARTDC